MSPSVSIRSSCEFDAFERANGAVSDDHAGVERGEQMFLRIGVLVGAAEFQRFVDLDREIFGDPFAANRAAGHAGVRPRAAPPMRGDLPISLAFGGIAADRCHGAAQSAGVDAVDFVLFECGVHNVFRAWLTLFCRRMIFRREHTDSFAGTMPGELIRRKWRDESVVQENDLAPTSDEFS